MDKLKEFVSRQRDRLIEKHNNAFAFSWSKVFHRWGFLEIIIRRYADASSAFIANTKETRDALPPGSAHLSPEADAIQSQAYRLKLRLDLEIESYYLFAKIILDDVARAIEYYFGPEHKLSLDSHDDLAKDFRAYATPKGLEVTGGLFSAIADLKTRVCDYRDYQIAHEKSPRTMRGITWSSSGGDTRTLTTRLYPKATDTQSEAEPLDALHGSLAAYFDLVADFLVSNAAKANLKFATPVE